MEIQAFLEEYLPALGAAYAQSDPLVAYKRESHDMWDQLLANIRRQLSHSIYQVEVTQRSVQQRRQPVGVESRGAEADAAAQRTPVAVGAAAGARSGGAAGAAGGKARKIGRNQPCPCGSGKKYKKCHGMAA